MTRRRHFVYVSRSITSRGLAVGFQQNLSSWIARCRSRLHEIARFFCFFPFTLFTKPFARIANFLITPIVPSTEIQVFVRFQPSRASLDSMDKEISKKCKREKRKFSPENLIRDNKEIEDLLFSTKLCTISIFPLFLFILERKREKMNYAKSSTRKFVA